MISQQATSDDILFTEPKITPQIIQSGAKGISEWIIAGLSEREDEASMASSAGLKDVLKNIVLEVDSASYEKFKPEIEAILQKRMKKYQRSVITYCDEIVQLLNISENGAHPLKQIIIQDFRRRLAFQFSFWNHTKDRSELDEKFAKKIPWDDVFRSISAEIRAYTLSVIKRYEAEETSILDKSGKLRNALSQKFEKRAQSLVNLKNKIKNEEEKGGDQAHDEPNHPDPNLLRKSAQEMINENSDQADFIEKKKNAQGVDR